jgi:alkylation response protein AidB-like acyl-CoA dehydrogenase
MTQELQEIRALARDFATAALRPHTETWDARGTLDDDVAGKLAELGFFGMLAPEHAGGMGLDAPAWVAAVEELAWGEAAVAVLVAHSVIAADLIARYGSTAVQEQWLAALATGAQVGCIAFASADVRAHRTGDRWRIAGTTRWVANGDRAAVIVLRARAGDGATGVFVIPAGAGVRVAQRYGTLGLRPLALVDMALDVTVPASARLHDGAADAAAEDALGRLSAAAIAVGIAQAALDHAVRYSGEREQFGRPIRSFEGLQRKLAEMATRTVAARALVERAAADPDDPVRRAMAKLVAAECAMYVTTEAVQIFGGYGYMRDYPVEKLMRDAKAMEIMHGPNEVQRVRIAESLRA